MACEEGRTMEYRNLGGTGLKVSELVLGTMQFGWTTDEANAFAVMDAFLGAGGNLVDTADVYSNWAAGNPGGVAESIIGRWMRQRGNRHRIVLATKVRGRMWEGPNGEGLSRAHIVKAIDDSLRRLGTDYIDLYQTHWFDPDTPVEETLRALDALVSVAPLPHPFSDHGLCHAPGVARDPVCIDIGGIEEIAPSLQEGSHDGESVLLIGGPTELHSPQAKF